MLDVHRSRSSWRCLFTNEFHDLPSRCQPSILRRAYVYRSGPAAKGLRSLAEVGRGVLDLQRLRSSARCLFTNEFHDLPPHQHHTFRMSEVALPPAINTPDLHAAELHDLPPHSVRSCRSPSCALSAKSASRW